MGFKSKKVRNSLSPEWNFSTDLTWVSAKSNTDIVIEIYDDDFGSENFIGSYTLSLKQAIMNSEKEGTWQTLVGCKTGKIFFSTIFSPEEEPGLKGQNDLKKDETSPSKEKKESDKTNKDIKEDGKEDDGMEKCKETKDKSELKEEDKTIESPNQPKKVDKELTDDKPSSGDKESTNITVVPELEVENNVSSSTEETKPEHTNLNGESSVKENIDDLKESVQSLEKSDDLPETKKDTPSLDPQNNEVRTGALGLKDVMNLKKEEQNDS